MTECSLILSHAIQKPLYQEDKVRRNVYNFPQLAQGLSRCAAVWRPVTAGTSKLGNPE